MTSTDFTPRWASPPGETIREALAERALSDAVLPDVLELPMPDVEELLAGLLPLTIELADRLTTVVGGSVEFWMTRDGQYHADLARVAADEWAQQMPFRDMVALGWVAPEADSWVGQIDACLDFFGVADLPTWEHDHQELVDTTRFRTSSSVETDDLAVAAWLRQCDRELSQVECGPWDKTAFTALLPDLLPLTRVSDPQKFLPELTNRCAATGVAVGVVRTPRRCPISGAARRLSNGQPSIALTGRYRSDDHLWFTFFHEAAHLVLHDSDVVYVDQIENDSDRPASADEEEADRFAGEILVPPAYEDALKAARRTPLELTRLARQIGVSTGIVIGHLQHRELLGYRTKLNGLKCGYKWMGSSLEKA